MVEAALLLKGAAALLPKAWDLAKTTSKSLGAKVSYDFRIAHEHYCVDVVKKYCRARTFFIRDEPRFLDDFYVAASIIKRETIRVPRAGLNDLSEVARRTIVVGSGGSGKTIFMRHLLLDAIQSGERYPVFIELRALNDLDHVDLESLIVDFMLDHKFPLDATFARQSLYDGLLVVLLDGFDEVVVDKRKHLEKEIRKVGTKSASQIVVSSRQDSLLEGWENFSTVRIAPLELDEACELIEKIPFQGEDEIKSRFVQRLREGLFESHRHFLSNPLLLSIMLLTYGDSADIPSKFSSFYEQAYAALFQKHDALKSGYRRERQGSLDILDFSRLFAAFSAITYDKRIFRFSLTEGIAHVDVAKKLVGLSNTSSEGFLEDARQAVCLLIEDGLEYSYVHRSFQEFFVAKFIAEASQGMKAKFLDKLIAGIEHGYEGENVIQLLYEMNPALVEEHYLMPETKKFFGADLGKRLSKAKWRALFLKLFDNVRTHASGQISYGVRSRRHLSALLFLSRNCCDRLPAKTGRSNKALYEELSIHLGDAETQLLKELPVRSPVWDALSDDAMTFSLHGMEKLRTASIEIEARIKERSSALAEIFAD